MKIIIIDYGAGNIKSIQFAFKRLGLDVILSNNIDEINIENNLILDDTNRTTTSKQSREPTTKTKITNKRCRLFFFWSDAMAGAIACGQTKQIKRQQASNHANQHKLMNFETGPAPQIPKATPRLAEVVAWLGRPQRGWAVFFFY